MRRVPIQALMPALAIEKMEILAELHAKLRQQFVGLQIDVLILHSAPQLFHEYVVDPPALAVHADHHPGLPKHTGEGLTRELRTLISVEDLRRAAALQGFRRRLNTEITIQGNSIAVRLAPCGCTNR